MYKLMQTAKWGKHAWIFLTSVIYSAPKKLSKKQQLYYIDFFTSVKDILPCKYCRQSFNQYLKELPIEPYITTRDKLIEWIYLIHNKVNEKLRKQGYIKYADPSRNSVIKLYNNKYVAKTRNIDMDFWLIPTIQFLYSIIFNNIRKKEYIIFFNSLEYILPHTDARKIYKKFIKNNPIQNSLSKQSDLLYWMFSMVNEFKLKPGIEGVSTEYATICKFYDGWRAKCGISKGKKGPSCRIPTSKKLKSQLTRKYGSASIKK